MESGMIDATSPKIPRCFIRAGYAFENAKQAVAFVGLAPNPHQSGDSEKPQLSKKGLMKR